MYNKIVKRVQYVQLKYLTTSSMRWSPPKHDHHINDTSTVFHVQYVYSYNRFPKRNIQVQGEVQK